ncbi:Transcriptional regulator [Pseudomonas marincola]|uniref:Transcriptional regulator n=1 Tax=Pseudomonas marincola TaxID=437900 RepID=A0A653E830_9PSED|nr:LysR family transcriptional regulator [Pseudomonas marincola]CAE6917019.1 Transcriptional regulator [Pseudomonas marincola]
MDRFQAMQVFTRIVQVGGFGKAADSLGLPRATVTQLIKQLERHLGVQLLQRTTRQVSTTADGQAYYEHCIRLLADLEDTENCFAHARSHPQGKLRVDLPASVGHRIVIPRLGDFCQRYPQIELEIGTGDRPVDLVREGIDCVVRAGNVHDINLVSRPLAQLPQITCASADYIERYGEPLDLAQLAGHQAVNFYSALNGKTFAFEFTEAGEINERYLPGAVSVNNAEAYVAASVAGLGIIQAPYYHLHQHVQAGRLREILPEYRPPAMPLTALYPAQRQLSRRVRVWVDWLVEVFTDAELYQPKI